MNKEILVALLPKKSALDLLKNEGWYHITSLWRLHQNAGRLQHWRFIRAKCLEVMKHIKFVTSGKYNK